MKWVIPFAVVVVGLLYNAHGQERPKSEKGEAMRLVGDYQIVEGQRGSEKISAERLKDTIVRITDKVITTFDKDKKEVYAATYEVDTAAKPWRIMMTATLTPVDGKGTKTEGLIEADGDTVRLIYALPGGKTPTDFKVGDKQQMFVLKKS